MRDQGHAVEDQPLDFELCSISTKKPRFAFDPRVYICIARLASQRNFGAILLPIEKKLTPLILWVVILRWLCRFRLISYNHPHVGGDRLEPGMLDRVLTKFLFNLYDRVVFYTKDACEWAIKNKLVIDGVAAFANNTLDTDEILNVSSFQAVEKHPQSILFIGRLIKSKRLATLFDYYEKIKRQIPSLRLHVIGDGPESAYVRQKAASDRDIFAYGSVTDESQIADIMRHADVVFVPGHSGLCIVHAFCYGKPFLTITTDQTHPPEIDYLIDGVNGLCLDGSDDDISRIVALLSDDEVYERMRGHAIDAAKSLAVSNWCEQMIENLRF